MVSVFESIYVMNYTYWFLHVEPSLNLCGAINLIRVNDLFGMILNSVCQYFTGNFCIYVHHRDYKPLCVCVCVCDVCVCERERRRKRQRHRERRQIENMNLLSEQYNKVYWKTEENKSGIVFMTQAEQSKSYFCSRQS